MELFVWCEILPYLLADEIIFTNINQMEYMLSYLHNQSLERLVREKARISAQPTLPKNLYHELLPQYDLPTGYVHIAYFGSFYGTRDMDEIFGALAGLGKQERDLIQLHIFTQQREQIENSILYQSVKNLVRINDYVDYLEFLNLCTRFTCLLVNDAATLGLKKLNPYLPSKLSDYLGSGTPIWALYEEGSALAEVCAGGKIAYFSKLDHKNEHTTVLRNLARKESGICQIK
jgi:hypothetical protein